MISVALDRAIEEHARLRPNATALVCSTTGVRRTYADLEKRSGLIAQRLAFHGVKRGDRVAVLAHNDALTFELLMACSRLGAALVPLNIRLSDVELEPILTKCEPRLLFVDEAHRDRARGYEGARLSLAESSLIVAGDEPKPVDTSVGFDEPLVILFTSGTTGKPKGAILTRRNLAANAASTRQAWELTDADVALVDAPLFHTGGLNVLATPLFYEGGTVIVAPRFDAVQSGEILVREGCTISFGVPTMLERLLASGVVDRSKVRLWVTGGAPCPRSLLDAFAERKRPLLQGFGMTECGPNCFRPLAAAALGSIGLPTFGLEARLVDDSGKDVSPGEPGELWLRGPQVFAGYFRDEQATRTALEGNGWLRTGDVLRSTPEGWFVAGRKKEMFISGGENVYPAEVEAALTMYPSIAEAAIVSVPDPKWGEAGVGYVIVRGDASLPTAEDLRLFLRERIAAYKVPRTIYVERDLPRTATGKIDKRTLAALAAAPAN